MLNLWCGSLEIDLRWQKETICIVIGNYVTWSCYQMHCDSYLHCKTASGTRD